MDNYTKRINETFDKFHSIKPRKVNLGKIDKKDYIQTQRQFLVTLYEENTEYLGCLNMLAQIAQWFKVDPMVEPENTAVAKANAAELVRRWNAFEEGGLVGELVGACEEMVSYIEANNWEAEFADPMPSIKAALAKAKGS